MTLKKSPLLKLSEYLKWFYLFSRFVINQFTARRGYQSASSLAYTSLLSLVPLIGLLFSFFGNLTVFQEISNSMQDFIFGNFVPEFGRTIQQYLINFSLNASKLTTTGIAALIVIALMMMATIESTFNHIWNVISTRKIISRFLIYWAVLTMGPILVGLGLYATSYVLAIPMVSSVDSTLMLKAKLFSVMPFISSTFAFTLMYVLIPNCYVDIRNAFAGGLFAALFFEVAKYGFGFYVKSIDTYQLIYGALAVIPMFLIWIYVSWLIILLGAQVSYSLSVFRIKDIDNRDKPEWNFMDVYHIVEELWKAQKFGEQLTSAQLKRRGINIPHLMINRILELLKKRNWVYRTNNGRWLLSRDMNEVSLYDLYKILPVKFPEAADYDGDESAGIEKIIEIHKGDLQRSMNIPMAQIFRNESVQ